MASPFLPADRCSPSIQPIGAFVYPVERDDKARKWDQLKVKSEWMGKCRLIKAVPGQTAPEFVAVATGPVQ